MRGRRTLAEKRAEKAARANRLGALLSIPGVTPSGRLGQENVPVSEYPAAFDWSKQPQVMGKIHTQKASCASCWAYTSTDTIEAQAVISGRREKHVELSAEQLINCDGYDSGCNTGNMFTAYEWIHENGGLATAGRSTARRRRERPWRRWTLRRRAAPPLALGGIERRARWASTRRRYSAPRTAPRAGFHRERPRQQQRELPVNLQLMDRVFGYCELDFEAGGGADGGGFAAPRRRRDQRQQGVPAVPRPASSPARTAAPRRTPQRWRSWPSTTRWWSPAGARRWWADAR